MVDKALLSLFSVSWETATKNEDFLPEFVNGSIKFEWDNVEKKYTDKEKCIVVNTFWYGLKKSKFDVVLPANSVTQSTLEDLNQRADKGEDISIIFKNFSLALKVGYNGEIQIVATADNMAIA